MHRIIASDSNALATATKRICDSVEQGIELNNPSKVATDRVKNIYTTAQQHDPASTILLYSHTNIILFPNNITKIKYYMEMAMTTNVAGDTQLSAQQHQMGGATGSRSLWRMLRITEFAVEITTISWRISNRELSMLLTRRWERYRTLGRKEKAVGLSRRWLKIEKKSVIHGDLVMSKGLSLLNCSTVFITEESLNAGDNASNKEQESPNGIEVYNAWKDILNISILSRSQINLDLHLWRSRNIRSDVDNLRSTAFCTVWVVRLWTWKTRSEYWERFQRYHWLLLAVKGISILYWAMSQHYFDLLNEWIMRATREPNKIERKCW